jgi:uncharacterized protein (DUF305 family)
MLSNRKHLVFAMLLSPLGAAACASSGGTPEPSSSAPPDSTLARLEALYHARADSALMEVNEADVAFMTGMIHHHSQALVMSALAPTNGASEAVLRLTSRITNAQTDEISVMRRWLTDRGRPAPEIGQGSLGMITGADHSMHMPGMLSQQQLDDLAVAQGTQYDRLFLTYMIQHHNGAVEMVHDLFASDGAAQDEFVFKLASDIQVDQTTEVARMQQMLDTIPNDPNS